jgi:hypothetical protein
MPVLHEQDALLVRAFADDLVGRFEWRGRRFICARFGVGRAGVARDVLIVATQVRFRNWIPVVSGVFASTLTFASTVTRISDRVSPCHA